jgi:hypothetical protein
MKQVCSNSILSSSNVVLLGSTWAFFCQYIRKIFEKQIDFHWNQLMFKAKMNDWSSNLAWTGLVIEEFCSTNLTKSSNCHWRWGSIDGGETNCSLSKRSNSRWHWKQSSDVYMSFLFRRERSKRIFKTVFLCEHCPNRIESFLMLNVHWRYQTDQR